MKTSINAYQVYVGSYDPREVIENGNFVIEQKWYASADIEKLRELGIENFRLATTDDLRDWVCATGEVFKGIVVTADGMFKWSEYEGIDELGFTDYRCEYVPYLS